MKCIFKKFESERDRGSWAGKVRGFDFDMLLEQSERVREIESRREGIKRERYI